MTVEVACGIGTLTSFIHVLHAQIFGQMFDEMLGQIFDQCLARVFGTENTVHRSTDTEKYGFTTLLGRTNTVLQLYWDGEKR